MSAIGHPHDSDCRLPRDCRMILAAAFSARAAVMRTPVPPGHITGRAAGVSRPRNKAVTRTDPDEFACGAGGAGFLKLESRGGSRFALPAAGREGSV